MRFLLLLVVFTSLYVGLLWKTQLMDYDEGVYAEVSREMFVKNAHIVPTLNGEGFFEKPPMLFWGQMLGYRYFGTTSFGARFINALAGIAAILFVFLAGRKPLGKDTSFKAACILGTSLFFVYLSRIAIGDMLMMLFFILCLCFFWWAIERSLHQKNGAPFFWAGCAFAGLVMLTQGAIAAFFPFVTLFLYLLSIGRLRLLFKRTWIIPGSIIFLLIGLSWYLILGFTHPQGFTEMWNLLLKLHVERFTLPLNGHSGPIYFYLIVLLVGFIPWSGYLPFAVLRCPYLDSSNIRIRFLRLFIIFSLITLGFFTASATKLPNYICPALPGFAMMTATLFDEKEKTKKWAWSIATYVAAFLILAMGVILLTSPQIISHLPDMLGKSALKAPILAQPIHLGFIPYLSGLILVVAALGLIFFNRTQSTAKLFAALMTATLVLISVLFFIVLPTYDRLTNKPLARLAEQAEAKTPPNGRIIMLEVLNRPSVNFYSHRSTILARLDNIAALKNDFQDPKNQVGITTEYYFSKLKETGAAAEILNTDHGYVLFHLLSNNP